MGLDIQGILLGARAGEGRESPDAGLTPMEGAGRKERGGRISGCSAVTMFGKVDGKSSAEVISWSPASPWTRPSSVPGPSSPARKYGPGGNLAGAEEGSQWDHLSLSSSQQ